MTAPEPDHVRARQCGRGMTDPLFGVGLWTAPMHKPDPRAEDSTTPTVAGSIFAVLRRHFPGHPLTSTAACRDICAVVLPLVCVRIDNVEQLDALPDGQIIRDAEGDALRKDVDLKSDYGDWIAAGYQVPFRSTEVALPAFAMPSTPGGAQ